MSGSKAWLERNAGTLICGALAVLLAVPPAVIGASLWISKVTRAYIYDDARQVPARPVAIVPGTAVEHGAPSLGLTQRLAGALELYRAGKTRWILVSGARRDQSYDEVTAMHQWLVAHGVPESDVIDDPAGFRTLDTMDRAARVFGVKGAIVCSQGVHLPRAVYLAQQIGIDAVGLVVNPNQSRHPLALRHETLGSALALFDVAIGRGALELGTPRPIQGDTDTTAQLLPSR